MSEAAKNPVGEKPNVVINYGGSERARMETGEPKKNTQDQGGVEESKPPGNVEPAKPRVVQR